MWVNTDLVEAVGQHIHQVNTSSEPQKLSKNEHFCQVLPIIFGPQNTGITVHTKPPPTPNEIHRSHIYDIKLNPETSMPPDALTEYRALLNEFADIFLWLLVGVQCC